VAAQVRYDDASDVEATLLLNEATNGQPQHAFDLEERTAVFGERIVRFSKRIPRDPTNNRLINQLVGCGTSVGANYCEANEGVSGKDFRNIVGRCVKEAKETKYFLRMIAAAEPTLAATARELYSEARSCTLFSRASSGSSAAEPIALRAWRLEASLDVGCWMLEFGCSVYD
jgi:four helix bundle protein